MAGFINLLFLAVGPIAKLFTRQIHFTIQAWSGRDCSFPISGPLLEELHFWFLNIEAFNGYGIQLKFSPGAVIFCDASVLTFGGFQVRFNDQPVSGMFSPFDSKQSSTFREAHVVLLRHKRVKVFSGNQNTCRIVLFGSPKQHLQSLAIDVFWLCLENGIQIHAQWIPSKANFKADALSHFLDKNDWSLNSEVFAQLDCKWGPHSIDHFASHYNAQVPRLNSKFTSLGCSAVYAFSQDWRGKNIWLCSPVSLVVDVIRCT